MTRVKTATCEVNSEDQNSVVPDLGLYCLLKPVCPNTQGNYRTYFYHYCNLFFH